MTGCKYLNYKTIATAVLCLFLFVSNSTVMAAVTVRIQDYMFNDVEVANATLEIIDEFESKFPNIKIKIEKINSYEEAINNLKEKNPPDITRVDTYDVKHLSDYGLIQSLNKYVEEKGAIDYYWIPQFAEHAMVPCLSKKKDMYAVPQEGSPILMLINTEICKNAGLDIETNPIRNWDMFLEYILKVTDANKGVNGFGADFVSLDRAPQNFYAWLLSANADLFDEKGEESLLNSKESEKAYIFLISLYTKHKVMPQGITTLSNEKLAKMFANEKLAILQSDFETTKLIYETNPEMRSKTKVIPFPGEIKYAGRSSAFCLNKKSENPTEAFEFLEYLTIRPSLLRLFKTARMFPARRWLYRGTIVEQDKDGNIYGKYSNYTTSQRMPSEWPEIKKAIIESLQEAFTGNVTPQEAVKALHKRVKKIM